MIQAGVLEPSEAMHDLPSMSPSAQQLNSCNAACLPRDWPFIPRGRVERRFRKDIAEATSDKREVQKARVLTVTLTSEAARWPAAPPPAAAAIPDTPAPSDLR